MWPWRLAIASLSTLSFPSTHNSQVKDKENKKISFAWHPNHPPKHYVNKCRNKCHIAAHRESLNRNDHDTMSSSIIDEEKRINPKLHETGRHITRMIYLEEEGIWLLYCLLVIQKILNLIIHLSTSTNTS